MINFHIEKFTPVTAMPRETATQVVDLFTFNYPESHSDEDRTLDFLEKWDAAAIAQSLANGSTYYIGRPEGEENVAGFLQAKQQQTHIGPIEVLKWVMVEREYRGKRLASLLHRAFAIDANERARSVDTPSFAMLSVHKQNEAFNIYTGWGYQPYGPENSDDTITLAHPLPFEDL